MLNVAVQPAYDTGPITYFANQLAGDVAEIEPYPIHQRVVVSQRDGEKLIPSIDAIGCRSRCQLPLVRRAGRRH